MLLSLPKEMFLEISYWLSYKFIRSFGITCYDAYSQLDRLLKHKQRVTKNFPRIEGKCKIHKIQKDYKIIKDDVPLNYWFEFNKSIYFNMALVLAQCIENLKLGDDGWCTHF